MFCDDAILLGTVSTKRRKGDEILDYFYFFAKLPNIEVISSNYNIQKIGNNVYTNTNCKIFLVQDKSFIIP